LAGAFFLVGGYPVLRTSVGGAQDPLAEST
jgi:hypothetical protein